MDLTKERSKELNDILDNASKEEVLEILKQYKGYELKGSHLGRAFEKLFVGEGGVSSFITSEELEKCHQSFHTTNGGDWCRSEGSYLGGKYIIDRTKVGGKIFSVRTEGYKEQSKVTQGARSDILKQIKTRKCVILDIETNIECDHKDAMKDTWRHKDKSLQSIDDFQALSKIASEAKRKHCQNCINSGKRYDARQLGYKESYTSGNEKSKTCKGCYWNDPIMFNSIISQSFNKISK